MTLQEAIVRRVKELCREKHITEYALTYQAGMPSSTVKSILSGKSRNPGVLNVAKIADGLNLSVREFYDSILFEDVELPD